MSKIACDVCGTTYDDASGSCPVCGWSASGSYDADLDTDFLDEDLELDDTAKGSAPSKKGRAAFDYDAVNSGRRPTPKPVVKAEEEDDEDDDDEEEESGSNTFLVVVLVILILALLAVSAYIGWTKILKPKMGSDDNKPQETITTPVEETTEVPTYVADYVTEATEVTVAGIPCTNLAMVGNMEKLTFAGQYWRLMVKTEPEDTTDRVVYTSGNEAVVTIDEYGRITAVGEGETNIVITCGSQTITVPVVVQYEAEQTEETTIPETVSVNTPVVEAGTTVATPSSTLKLNKTDLTIGRIGVYVTLEAEGIAAEDIKWSTSDSRIATVYNGNVTALGRGTCVITAEYNGQTAQCVIRCKF